MATSSPDGISSALASTIVSVDTALDEAEQALRPYVVAPLKTALAKLDPLDSARLMTALAFSATSLLYVLLRLDGVDPRASGHPVMDEVEAARRLFARIDEAAKVQARRDGLPMSRVDSAAAERFVRASLGSAATDTGAGKDSVGGTVYASAVGAKRLRDDSAMKVTDRVGRLQDSNEDNDSASAVVTASSREASSGRTHMRGGGRGTSRGDRRGEGSARQPRRGSG